MADTITATILAPVIKYVLQPADMLLATFAIVIFVWGVAQLILNGEDSEKRLDAQRHILWGVIGLFIMFAVFGIIRFVASTMGLSVPLFS